MRQQTATPPIPILPRRGFTIVELLIVVVVIAILATITVVAYNGIQKRAGTAMYASAVDGIEKQARLALTDESATLDVGVSCVGEVSDYPATAEFSEGSCFRLVNADGNFSEFSVDEASIATLRSAGVGIPRGLPTGNPLRITALDGQAQYIRGMLVMSWGRLTFILIWVPPDSSACSRGQNQAANLVNQLEQEISAIKADAARLADAVSRYGEDWEQAFRSLNQVPGYCTLSFSAG